MLVAVSFTALADDAARVRVGLAWQPNDAAYERVILSIEQAGGEAVILPQMRPAGFDYDGMSLCPQYVDEMGVLCPQYADIVKRDTYHGTDAEVLLAGVQAVVFLGGGDISSTLFAVPQTWHGLTDDSPADATRDVSEYLTMAYCLDHDIPVLGLCRGMQMLGVVSGASLIQDLGTYYEGLGKPYHYGGKGPNAFDCAGFARYVYQKFGFTLPGGSAPQYRLGRSVKERTKLQKGDLVFFQGRSGKGGVGHTGIVTEVDTTTGVFRFIHAATSTGVIYSYSTEEYYAKRYIGARRLLGDRSKPEDPLPGRRGKSRR